MAALKLSECICPICLGILIEPVTLPCKHELCMPCFKKNVEEANLTCPMCRLRISNWARKQAGNLIDQKRWKRIREAFPELCQKRLLGDEDDDVLDLMTQPHRPVIHVAAPGEIGQEYKKEFEKVQEERRREAEEAQKRSEEYIRKLQREEVLQYERRKEELKSLEKEDAELARKLAEEDPTSVGHVDVGEVVDEQVLQDEELAKKLQMSEESTVAVGEVIDEQVLQDEELARKLQMSEQSTTQNTPRLSPDVVVISSSGSSTGKTGASSIKCLNIEKFLSPAANRSVRVDREESKEPIIILDDQPSTSTGFSGERRHNLPKPKSKDVAKPRGAFSPIVIKSPCLEAPDDSSLRAHSTDSNDSISVELSHFKPIDVSPRTARRKLPDGRAESPPIVLTTPRNLKKMDVDPSSEDASAALLQMSPLLKARWQELEMERKEQLDASSKSTMTNIARHLNKHLTRHAHHSRSVRRGDCGDGKGEPPLKRAKMEKVGVSGGGDGVKGDAERRVAKSKDADQEEKSVNTLLQMRVVTPQDEADNARVPPVNSRSKSTEMSHNSNKNAMTKSTDSPPSNGVHTCEKSVVSQPDGITKDHQEKGIVGAEKRHDETDGRVKRNGKKVHSTGKVYAMREQTKLKTRVTMKSIKDLFGAKRKKAASSTLKSEEKEVVETVVSDPPLPSLELPTDTNTKSHKMPCSSDDDFAQGNAEVNKTKNNHTVANRISPKSPPMSNKVRTATNIESELASEQNVSDSTSNDAKTEISYKEWLSSNGCVTGSMQANDGSTGSKSKCVTESDRTEGKPNGTSKHAHRKEQNSSLSDDKSNGNDGAYVSKLDIENGNVRNQHSSGASFPSPSHSSGQSSDVSMTSVDIAIEHQDLIKTNNNNNKSSKSRKKGKKGKEVASWKPPRKSEETIDRYMALLTEEERRLKQEEEDRLLAQRLQKKFDVEERAQRNDVNRTKGSEDAYSFREHRRQCYNYME